MEYRIASVADCDELTRLRMAMRKERDADFCEDALYANTLPEGILRSSARITERSLPQQDSPYSRCPPPRSCQTAEWQS